MSVRIYPLRTGSVRVKEAQCARKPGGPLRVLVDPQWTDPLPIYAWLIDHPEGPIVVDTGETCRAMDDGYFPSWHPYYRWAVEMDVGEEDEIAHRLTLLRIAPSEVRTVVLTHFHTDHAGGLHHFPKSRIWVSSGELAIARGFLGRIRGYLPNRWPSGLAFREIPFGREAFGPFQAAYPLTRSGDVTIVPTPGHTPGHVSVIVTIDGVGYFLAGDASYSERALLEKRPDGVTTDPWKAVDTLERILLFSRQRPLVYLPAHDPESVSRLETGRTLSLLTGAGPSL